MSIRSSPAPSSNSLFLPPFPHHHTSPYRVRGGVKYAALTLTQPGCKRIACTLSTETAAADLSVLSVSLVAMDLTTCPPYSSVNPCQNGISPILGVC